MLLLFGGPTVAAQQSAVPFYQLLFAQDLQWVDVEARFAGDVAELEAWAGKGSKLSRARDCDGVRLRTRRGRLQLKGARCVRYRYPLERERDGFEGRSNAPVLTTSPARWLWLPSHAQSARIQVSLPSGVQGFFPWLPTGQPRSYLLPLSPQSAPGLAVLGKFATATIALGENRALDVALVGINASNRRKLLHWLEWAARGVDQAAERALNDTAKVIVVDYPSRAGSSPVPFGHVVRDGTEVVRFFVDQHRSIDDLKADWTASHEFAHLLLPYVDGRQKWISEGFASYFQNVLMARQGSYSEREAWTRLTRSFAKASAITRPPAPSEAYRKSFWEVRMLVYWSGAALALQADVELRRRSDGAESLDQVLARLARCCLPGQKVWPVRELMSTLDGLTDYPVFVELHQQIAYQAGMPDQTKLYAELGIRAPGSNQPVVLNDTAPLAGIRRSIMSTD